ncbi:class I SAM-dependent methyltransferase [Wenjunlia tyrosinilytica]|uniref:Class I SAM-dependent methyltransferase n=1 Tax=Wenjunlia tyrosinilytica TaxID=1544741 RepID=A0A918DSC2_9ACTN|nr:class I SAM-dependent methyltransferase [Wenjunlia tyrosinilytica]GGO80144.1 hypothetical protein GCM10012280_01320 [Wenjunlia tyrosinilytica]
MSTATAVPSEPRPSRLDDVKGWFPGLDQVLFDWLLSRQARLGERGDVVEMGAFMGKSAIFTAAYLRKGERFTVCDLFDAPAPDEDNAAETRKSYSTLTRVAFERNYLSFHDELPHVVQGPTSEIPDHVAPATCRFVHVDASHLYVHVAGDMENTRRIVVPEGIVVLDDFRSEHTPGVAAATWEAVFTRGLRPIALSTQKFYGTWGDPGPIQEDLLELAAGRDDLHVSVPEIAGSRVLRFSGRAKPPTGPRSRFPAPVPPPAPTPAAAAAAAAPAALPSGHSSVRRLAKEILPPVLTRALRRRLRRG